MIMELIQPKMNKRPMDTNLKTQMAPSLALFTLKSLTPDNHIVTITNENTDQVDFEKKVDLVAITVTVDVFNRAVWISDEYRRRGVAVVAGGIHITAAPEACSPYFDSICIGPAERVWEKIIDDCEKGALQKIYKDVSNMRGHEIASPDYNGIDQRKYLYTNVISTSRGCPHRCDFCYNSCNGEHLYLNRPVESVIAEIQLMQTKHIMFVDDNFIGNPEWTRAFLLRIKPLHLKWNAAVTTKVLHRLDLLDLMAETGCQSLFIGFETIRQDSIERVHKNNCVEEYSKVVSEIHKRGIMVNASMVFGLPCDDSGVFKSTLEWLVKNKVETLTAHILTPYPGTRLHKRMLEEGRITDFDLSHYNTAHVVFRHDKLTEEELYEGYLNIYKQFYSFRDIFRRLPENKKQRKAYLLFNFFYRKFGKCTAFVAKIIPIRKIGELAIRISYRNVTAKVKESRPHFFN